jgi:hydroxyethylthiazole kinase-like uncharacterized protein yjeF
LQKILPNTFARPLFNAASSRAVETSALIGLPAYALMQRAGLSVARLALALQPKRQGVVWIVCGPGNNGGDGLVAARLLHSCGQTVQVSLIDTDRPMPPDASAALQAAQQAGVTITCDREAPPRLALTIDALLGLGLRRPPGARMAAAINHMNALSAPRLAVDLPSGLLADSGTLAGTQALNAQHTLALLTLKPGLFTAQGRAHCGELWFDDLGVAPEHRPDALLLGTDCMADWRQARNAAHHKGSHGDVLVLGGASGMLGAARLAGRAALAAGAGRVYLHLLDPQVTEVDPQRAELMRWSAERWAANSAWQEMTVVCGCGGNNDVASYLARLLSQARRLVLDADGLNGVAADTHLRWLLSQRAARGQATVLTPHPLEAARLLSCDSAAVQADRLTAARVLAEQFACTVILKGSGSLIATPGRTLSINASGNAALASAGTGDVLAGWLGGLWAQRPLADLHVLASAACCWHGQAGDTQAAGPLRAANLVERMHALHSPN